MCHIESDTELDADTLYVSFWMLQWNFTEEKMIMKKEKRSRLFVFVRSEGRGTRSELS